MSNKRRQRGKQLPSVPLELDSHSDEATCGGSDSASLSFKSGSSSSSEHSQSTLQNSTALVILMAFPQLQKVNLALSLLPQLPNAQETRKAQYTVR